MSPRTIGRIMTYARRLLRLGLLDTHCLATLDHLAWGAGRRPFAADVARSYAEIGRAIGRCRDTVVACVARLVAVGLLAKQRRAVQVAWHRGGRRNVQIANHYRLLPAPDCESATPTGDRESKKVSRLANGARAIFARERPHLPIRSVAEQIALL